MLYVCRPRSPLTIPVAMLFAKLTLCSHGNESCRDKKRERWIAGLVYNHTIIQPSVTARYAVREIERKSLHNGSRLLQTQITHTQTQLLKTLKCIRETQWKTERERYIICYPYVLCWNPYLKQTQWVIWKTFPLESLTWKHFIPPSSLIQCNHTTAFSPFHFTECVWAFQSLFHVSLSLSPCKVHLRWTETVTNTKTLTDDVRPFLEARGKEKRDFKIRTHRVTDKILQSASLNELCYQIKPLVLVQNPNELQNVWMIKTSHHFYLEKRESEREKNTNCWDS